MIMDLDQRLVAYGKQAVPDKVLAEIIADLVLVKIFPFNQKLGVIAEFKFFHILLRTGCLPGGSGRPFLSHFCSDPSISP
jgi:hypothetical protein